MPTRVETTRFFVPFESFLLLRYRYSRSERLHLNTLDNLILKARGEPSCSSAENEKMEALNPSFATSLRTPLSKEIERVLQRGANELRLDTFHYFHLTDSHRQNEPLLTFNCLLVMPHRLKNFGHPQ